MVILFLMSKYYEIDPLMNMEQVFKSISKSKVWIKVCKLLVHQSCLSHQGIHNVNIFYLHAYKIVWLVMTLTLDDLREKLNAQLKLKPQHQKIA